MNKTAGLSAFQRDRARKQHRKAAGPILDKALKLHQAGVAREAQALCLQVLENLSDHFDALHLLGLSKSEVGEFVEAEAILLRALQVDSRSAELLSNLGVVQSDMGQFEKARASYEKSIALRPNSPVAINNLGNAFLKLIFTSLRSRPSIGPEIQAGLYRCGLQSCQRVDVRVVSRKPSGF